MEKHYIDEIEGLEEGVKTLKKALLKRDTTIECLNNRVKTLLRGSTENLRLFKDVAADKSSFCECEEDDCSHSEMHRQINLLIQYCGL